METFGAARKNKESLFTANKDSIGKFKAPKPKLNG